MTIHARLSSRRAGSVFVRVGFERTLYANTDVLGLLRRQFGHHSAKPAHHKSGYLLIKLLGKHFNRDRVAALVGRQVGEFLIKEVNLRQYLVGKRTIHDARRMTRRIPQVDQTALRKEQQVVIAGCIANDFVPMEDNLGFDYPMAAADVFSDELQTQAQQILSELNATDSGDAFAITEAVNTALLDIDEFERYHNVYLPMTKHLVESLGFGALHSLYYRCESAGKTYRLGQDLMKLQAVAIKLGNPLSYDVEANQFHQQGVGILVNDLPHIPFLKEYDRYKMLDEARLTDCLAE